MKIKDTLIFRDKLSWKSHSEAWIFWLKLHTVFAQHEHQRRGCHGNPWRPRLGEGQTKCDLWNWHKPQFHVSRHLDLSVLASNLHELSSHGFFPPQFHLQTSLSPLRADFQYPCPENCKINSHQVKWCFLNDFMSLSCARWDLLSLQCFLHCSSVCSAFTAAGGKAAPLLQTKTCWFLQKRSRPSSCRDSTCTADAGKQTVELTRLLSAQSYFLLPELTDLQFYAGSHLKSHGESNRSSKVTQVRA